MRSINNNLKFIYNCNAIINIILYVNNTIILFRQIRPSYMEYNCIFSRNYYFIWKLLETISIFRKRFKTIQFLRCIIKWSTRVWSILWFGYDFDEESCTFKHYIPYSRIVDKYMCLYTIWLLEIMGSRPFCTAVVLIRFQFFFDWRLHTSRVFLCVIRVNLRLTTPLGVGQIKNITVVYLLR